MNVSMLELRRVAESIREREMGRKKIAEFIKTIGGVANLIKRIEESNLERSTVSGVDSGVVKKSMHGFDFVLIRPACVTFSYRFGKIASTQYFPSKVPVARLFVLEALSEVEWMYSVNTLRQMLEIKMALDVCERIVPELMVIDGSIVPHYVERPREGSPLNNMYGEMISSYKALYNACKERGTMLAGVIEDSRGRRFCEFIKNNIISKIKHEKVEEVRDILEKTKDTNLLFHILERGERTSTFSYAEKVEKNSVLSDLEGHVKEINSFYLKTARYDRPVRVDFLGNEETADKISSILLAISGHHSSYGMPSVLIEADNVAKLREEEIDYVCSQIMSYTGMLPGMLRLRRDSRPF